MGGVFRDHTTGEYRYYTINDYEERRLRDYDDHYNNRDPYGPSRPLWRPLPPPEVHTVQMPPVPARAAEPAPVWRTPDFDVDEFLTRLNAAESPAGSPPMDRKHALAILGMPEQADADPADFDLLIQSLPLRVGQNAAFDALFDEPKVVLTAQEALTVLQQPG